MENGALGTAQRRLLALIAQDLADSIRLCDPDFRSGIAGFDALGRAAQLARLHELEARLRQEWVDWPALANPGLEFRTLCVHLPRMVELEVDEEKWGLGQPASDEVRVAIGAAFRELSPRNDGRLQIVGSPEANKSGSGGLPESDRVRMEAILAAWKAFMTDAANGVGREPRSGR